MRDGERPRAPDCGSGHARPSPPRRRRAHVSNGVRCSELALHSVLAQSPQPTNARCARGEEPKARSFDCGAGSCWIDSVQRSEFLRTISVRLTPRANVRPEIRPQLREFLAWYEEVLGRIDAGAVVAPGEQERLTEEASAVAHLLDLLDSSADEPAS
jgi:hypothetical protein